MAAYHSPPLSPEDVVVSLAAPIKPLDNPLVKAIFGPLHLPAFGPSREYYVGRTPDNDFVLTGKYAFFTSRKHCKLVWDGYQTTITDLQSLNGTWVNESRLADGEVRTLRHRDTVAFTPLALDRRVLYSGRQLIGFEFNECLAKGRYPLEFEYHEYRMEDDFETTLSPVGRAVRRSLSELNRVNDFIRIVRSPQTVSHAAGSIPQDRVALSYRGSLDRPHRPHTPFYIPPWPIDSTPKLHGNKRLIRAAFPIPGPEDPDGVLADHPDIIWRNGVRYKHVPGIRSPPWQMLQWSNYYNLPVGLHGNWPLFSSTTYGARPSAEASLPPHSQRQEVYATFQWPSDERINWKRNLESPISPFPPAAAPLEMPSPPSIPHHSDHRALGELHARSSVAPAEIMHSALAASGLGLASSASASHSGGLSGPIVGAGLKRPRTPDDDAAGRPAKRVAIAASLPTERATSPRMLTRTARSPSPSTLSPLEPITSSPRRNMVSETIHGPALLPVGTRERRSTVLESTPSVPHASIGVLNTGSTSRKRKRQDEAVVVDVDATEPLGGRPVIREAATPSSDTPRALPSRGVPRKGRRVAELTEPIRRSLRVRKKAAVTVRGS
ncbi:hypothetical protein PENSPDRAFT_693218 [Peniophora sp. CONT]|nr:hypothetical protein PENSPDRAFT_693218 [Peniophora sp. CONT]